MLVALILAATLAAAPAAPTASERLNALSFDNGALLVEDGGSYSSGPGNYGAWALTDGGETNVWCSPSHRTAGLAFTWDLDTTWNLESFTINTRRVEEGSNPGISARTVELHLGDGKTFRKVGTFQSGKEELRTFPLPKGTQARQARLVVVANHGNAEYTEIAEVELLGQRAAPVPRPPLAGDFRTTYGPVRLAADGDEVYGCYDYSEGATLLGTLAGRDARLTWSQPADEPPQSGAVTFAIAADGSSFQGVWYQGGELRGEWNGTRIDRSEGARCNPRRKSQLDTLKKQKRLILYGIRFDTNADEPRTESASTLDEMAKALQEDRSLRVLVEGHTDSTNTDEYNLDLSQRRARKVVAALVQRGVAAERLEAKGFGRTRPVADNATAQGRALNRRVEISIRE